MEFSERVEMEFYRVWYICDYCNRGEMIYAGPSLSIGSATTMHKHRCNNCGITESFSTTYPKTEMRPVNARS